jgi:hypothetical protein
MPQFIQLGNLFINTSHIIYVDFGDKNEVLLVLASIDKEAYGKQFLASEEIEFSVESPEYHALRTWLSENCQTLVPFHEKVLEAGKVDESKTSEHLDKPEQKKQFEQAALNLYNEIQYQGLSTEVIREFLCNFTEHVINNIVPSDLEQASDMKSIKQIAQGIDDMKEVL